MAVPDIRKFSSGGAASVGEAIESWRVADRMPPGPANDGHVDDNRHRLDLSILGALGLSKGEASVLIGNVYESYSRWRRAIEAVEGMMRLNRKEMARNLSGRSVKPTDMAAQRVWGEVSAEFTIIPRDLLSGDEEFESVALPRKLRVRPGQPGLIPGLLVHSDGSQTDLGSFERVRYADMLLSIGFEPPLVIPIDSTRAGAIADVFERTRTELVNVASKRAALYVGSDDAVRAVVKAVERHWMRNCRLAGLEPRQRS